jgi:hypothetical protein
MASVPIQIDGVLWDHAQKKPTKVTLTGQASILGLGIGGGPIVPPPEPGEPVFPAHPIVPPGGYPPEGGQPPGIWGPTDPRPTPPIYWPGFPGQPPSGGQPPGGGSPGEPTFPIWGPPGVELPPGSGYPPVAGHPLPPGETPPEPIKGWEAKPVWTLRTGWTVIIVPTEGTEVPTPSAPTPPA